MKGLRLDSVAYEQGSAFSLTLNTAARQPVFSDVSIVGLCLRALREATARYSATVFAYCFMPDHLHLLVAVPEGTSLVNFVRQFKQLSAYRYRRAHSHDREALWQRRFYDHALRREEDLVAVATYVWDNPVRSGLVSSAAQYPHSGSFAWGERAVSGSQDPDLKLITHAIGGLSENDFIMAAKITELERTGG